MTKRTRALKDHLTGLRPREEVFARLCLRHTQQDAYRIAFQDPKRGTPTSLASKASKLATNPAVKARVRQLLDEAKISELETVGHAFQQLCADLQMARDLKNLTAVAALQRLKLQVLGMLAEHVMLNVESSISDEELIKRMAVNNPALAAVLSASIGRENSYDA